MKAIALTFDYNISGSGSLDSIGRHWAKNVYKNKEFIFRYSAASYSTFIHHNPEIKFDIHTDDVNLLSNELAKYNVDTSNVEIVDWRNELSIYKKHKYPFESVMQLVKKYKDSEDYLLKLDNDLICKSKLAIDENCILAWKYERNVSNGNPLWGEIHICNSTVGTTDFNLYNMGVMGLPKGFWVHYDEFLNVCDNMINIDISNITDVNSKIYHCCEQTAYNWVWHKYNYKINQAQDYFDHYFETKIECVKDAQYLLREKQ